MEHTTARQETARRRDALLGQIEDYIRANIRRKLTLREIAEHFGVSISTITQLYQKRAGTTFHNRLTAIRMETARELIAQGLPLEQVGRELGYADHSSFYRAFHAAYGVSPREYRLGKRN